jgi:hypothetical protein
MAAESTAAPITASDPIHTPCPHCGVIFADTPDPMGSLIACLRAVVEAQAPRVVTPRRAAGTRLVRDRADRRGGVMNEQEAADIIEATGADWLPCGCLGTQSEHTCGPRETGDDARDERAFERDEATGQPITVAFTLTFTVDYGRWRYAAGVLSGDDPVADFREYIQTAPLAAYLRDGMGMLADAEGTVTVDPIPEAPPECPGSGRQSIPGTGRHICPVCHRGARSIGLPLGAWRRGVTVPAHPARTEK